MSAAAWTRLGLPVALVGTLMLGAGLWGFWAAERQLLSTSSALLVRPPHPRDIPARAAAPHPPGAPAGDGAVPGYPRAQARSIAGMTLYFVPDPLGKALSLYSSRLLAHGWRPIAPIALLNRPPAASRAAGILLSYAWGNRRLDAWLAADRARRSPATVLMVLASGLPSKTRVRARARTSRASAHPLSGPSHATGGLHGKPAR